MLFFKDVRISDHHIINRTFGPEKYSYNYHQYPGLPFAFEFEDNWRYSGDDRQEWMQQNWHYSIYISITYVVIVTLLKKWMHHRKAFDLRLPLTLWSASLAVFSILGTIRCLPEFIDILVKKGFQASFCNGCYSEDTRLSTWYWIFVLSKTVELGDTIFIILRKQKLLKLHWMHHALTLCYSWYVFGDAPATARWMVNMNFTIHSIMYTYYTVKALRLHVPRFIAIFITTAQIVQMCFGLLVNARAFYFKLVGIPCDLSVSVSITGFAIYGLFFILFLNFFVNSYVKISFKYITYKDLNNNIKREQKNIKRCL